MGKKVIFNGIEILISEDNFSAMSFFDFTEELIDLLGKELDRTDENFHLNINTEFHLNRSPKHSISVNGLNNQKTKEKVMKILERTTNTLTQHVSGTVKVNLIIEDN